MKKVYTISKSVRVRIESPEKKKFIDQMFEDRMFSYYVNGFLTRLFIKYREEQLKNKEEANRDTIVLIDDEKDLPF